MTSLRGARTLKHLILRTIAAKSCNLDNKPLKLPHINYTMTYRRSDVAVAMDSETVALLTVTPGSKV